MTRMGHWIDNLHPAVMPTHNDNNRQKAIMAVSRWPLAMLFALLLQLATANDEYSIVSR